MPRLDVSGFDLRGIISTMLGTRDDWRLRLPPRPGRPHPGLAWVGPTLMIGATAAGWFAFADAVGEEESVAFALFVGAASILLMAWSNVLATRLRLLHERSAVRSATASSMHCHTDAADSP